VAAVELECRTDNLPAEVTRFIGRTQELAQVRDALGRYRLVTLRGVGGVGKTRLALRVGAAVRRSFDDGVWLVELSALRNTELLARTVAAALGVPDQAAGDPLDLLADYLTDRHLLLILDTCEHLVDACALLSAVLLRSAPRLRILATSREPLEVMGEQALLVLPLDTPEPDAPPADSDAVLLFLDRAQAMVPGFTLTPANEQAVAQLCQRLDGIPLALELAAVRLRTMSIEQAVARLDDRFRFLGTARRSQNRHQTLRAAVDWSHDLCTPEEQLLWARLSVFPGDFDLDAAECVCSGGSGSSGDSGNSGDSGDVLAEGVLFDVLARLVEKSVVQYEQDAHRYRLLDTLREYGAERLAALGEAQELRRRHRDHYLRLAEQAAAGGFGPGQVGWLARLQQETHNLRVALDFCYATPGEADRGLTMTVVLRHYWLIRGLFAEGRRWHDLALAASADSASADSADAAWAAYGAGVLAVQQGDFERANPLLDRAAERAAALADRDLAAQVMTGRGMALFHAGDVAGGQGSFESALASYAEIGYREPFALSVLPRLATACFLNGDLGRAVELCEQAMRLSEQLGDAWNLGSALWVRGAVRWVSGDTELAIEDALGSLRIKESLGDLHSITQSIDLLAVCLATTGATTGATEGASKADFVRAAELCGAGDALWKMLNTPFQAGPHYAAARQSGADACRAALGEEQFEAARRRGLGLSVSAAITLAKGEPAAPTRATPLTGAGAGARAGVGAVTAKPIRLTKRELQIAGMVAEGLGNRNIAERLVLSKRTVDAHIEHIFAKLGFSSRSQIAVWFSRQEQ
jgi:predicted ATPase/DNA-binding CsgD family transcriptional regulator